MAEAFFDAQVGNGQIGAADHKDRLGDSQGTQEAP
jgi:hypothetical protein